jgi:hypothetical protein
VKVKRDESEKISNIDQMAIYKLYPVKAKKITNSFHFTIFVTNRFLSGTVFQFLRDMYESKFKTHVDIKFVDNFYSFQLNFEPRKDEDEDEEYEEYDEDSKKNNLLCDKEFEFKLSNLKDSDIFIVLGKTDTQTKTGMDIAGFAVLTSYFEKEYYDDFLGRAFPWAAFYVDYLCAHNHLAQVGGKLMKLLKTICIAMNYLNKEKTGFILTSIDTQNTLDFYYHAKLKPINSSQHKLRLYWDFDSEKDFKLIEQTRNLKVGKRKGSAISSSFELESVELGYKNSDTSLYKDDDKDVIDKRLTASERSELRRLTKQAINDTKKLKGKQNKETLDRIQHAVYNRSFANKHGSLAMDLRNKLNTKKKRR